MAIKVKDSSYPDFFSVKTLGPQALAEGEHVYAGDSSASLAGYFLSSTGKTCPQRTLSSLDHRELLLY